MAIKQKIWNWLSYDTFIIFLLTILLPLIYIPFAIDSYYLPRCLGLSIILLIGIIRFIRTESIYLSRITLYYSIFLLLVLISGFAAVNISEFINSLSQYLLFGIGLVFLTNFVSRSTFTKLEKIQYFITFIVLLLSIMGLLQYFDIAFNSLPGTLRPFGLMARRNFYSSWLFLATPFVLSGIISDKKLLRILSIITFTGSSIMIVLAQARAVWLAYIAMAVTLLVVYYPLYFQKNSRVRYSFKQLTKVFIIVILGIFAINFSNLKIRYVGEDYQKYSFAERASTLSNISADTSANQRIVAWKNSLEMLKSNLIFGVGSGNWKLNLPAYGLKDFDVKIQSGYTIYLQAHNDFIEIACENGIIASIIYFVIFCYAIINFFRKFINIESENEKLFYLSCASVLLGYILISMIDFPKSRIEHNVLLMLILAFSSPESELKINLKRFFSYSLVLVLLLLTAFYSIRIFKEIKLADIYSLRANHKWLQVGKLADEVQNKYLYANDPVSVPVHYYKAESLYMLGKTEEALDLYYQILKLNPYNFHVLNDIGACYNKIGKLEDAGKYFEKALNIAPKFEDGLINISALHYNNGSIDKAYYFISQCNLNSRNPKVAKFYEKIKKAFENK